jgi:sialidase-1
VVDQPEYREARSLQGARCSTTADGGITWSDPVTGPDSVHGGCAIADGSILVASYRINAPDVCIYRGTGSPIVWNVRSKLPVPALRSTRFGEPHLAALPSGRVIVFLRSTAIPYDDMSERNLLWMSFSDDDGRTWVEPYPTPLWGFPPHLLVMADGRVLCTYGYRRAPFGQRACISEDGVTWKAENEIILREDAENGDLGYPASAELELGKIITVYYQSNRGQAPPRMRPPDPERSKPDIMASVWTLPPKLL